MARIITISTGSIKLEAELNDTSTADAVWNTLPYEAQGSVWGDELYFPIPEELDLELENEQDVVEAGDLGYWPTGRAMCLFFGPTPISGPGEIKPASAVNIIGRLQDDLDVLKKIPAGIEIKVSKY